MKATPTASSVLIPELIAEHEAKGTLHRGYGPYVAPEPTSGTLRFPGKALFLPAGRGTAAGKPAGADATSDAGSWLVTDTGHHRLVELGTDFQTVLRTYGSGTRATPTAPAPTSTPSSPPPSSTSRRALSCCRRTWQRRPATTS